MIENLYIDSLIERIFDKFSNIECFYEYDEMAGVHSIKVIPQNTFYSAAFQEFSTDLIIESIDVLKGESLAFLSEDALFDLHNPIKCYPKLPVLEGSLFDILKCSFEKNTQLSDLSRFRIPNHFLEGFRTKINLLHTNNKLEAIVIDKNEPVQHTFYTKLFLDLDITQQFTHNYSIQPIYKSQDLHVTSNTIKMWGLSCSNILNNKLANSA